MTIRDWLIVAGILILLGVVADLVRRYLQRGRLRLAIDEQYRDMPEVDLSSELPNGGARVIGEGQSFPEPEPSQPPQSATEQQAEQPAEQDWKIDPLLTGVSSQDGEVDLLLEQEFKGVGEGADRWLSQSGQLDDQPTEELLDDLGDGILSAPRVVQAAEQEPQVVAEPEVVEEPLLVTDPQPIQESQPIEEPQPEPLPESEASVEVAAEIEVEPEQSGIQEPEPEIQAEVIDEPLTNPLAEPQSESALAVADLEAGKPGLAVVSAEPEIDLERPVHELLQEQAVQAELQADPIESLGPAEPLVEPEPRPAPKPKKPAATRTREKSKSKREPRPEEQTSFFDLHPDLAPEVELPEPEAKPRRRRRKKAEPSKGTTTSKQQDQAPLEEEVLILNVKAKDQPFPGSLLFKLLNACGLTHGEMDIFHRHEEDEGQGALQFSVANAVAPGTFNPAEADGFSTPAVTFFLRLVDPTDRMNALECMLATAQCVADNLNGELKDENRSSIRSQTIEHYRQKVREFERKLLTRSS